MSQNKLSKSKKIVQEEGYISFLKKSLGYILPSSMSCELMLLLNERSIALPDRKGSWNIYEIPNLERNRKIPAVTETLSGTHLGSDRHTNMLKRMYTYDDFVEVEKNDIVVDVGAYVGGFSFYASQLARAVICIDPFASVDDSLRTNTSNLENVSVVPKAALDKSGSITINLSKRPSKTSILSPKTGSNNRSVQVASDTVPNIVRNQGFESIDYLKVEGEGVEPEILRGALEDRMSIKKIAVDAGPERDGEKVIDESIQILESNGYSCKVKDSSPYWGENIVFAK
ncbi:FkbM family methyltransferase [Salinibaculum rarum]|uniref:FkbM family methyltransferase n=1 Tax=Salinibaculum rarum TaxID=3058903 RepID=UPI00265D7F60|nr:FkbM family methyltransferase [Salinibaculum sp. KK48]